MVRKASTTAPVELSSSVQRSVKGTADTTAETTVTMEVKKGRCKEDDADASDADYADANYDEDENEESAEHSEGEDDNDVSAEENADDDSEHNVDENDKEGKDRESDKDVEECVNDDAKEDTECEVTRLLGTDFVKSLVDSSSIISNQYYNNVRDFLSMTTFPDINQILQQRNKNPSHRNNKIFLVFCVFKGVNHELGSRDPSPSIDKTPRGLWMMAIFNVFMEAYMVYRYGLHWDTQKKDERVLLHNACQFGVYIDMLQDPDNMKNICQEPGMTKSVYHSVVKYVVDGWPEHKLYCEKPLRKRKETKSTTNKQKEHKPYCESPSRKRKEVESTTNEQKESTAPRRKRRMMRIPQSSAPAHSTSIAPCNMSTSSTTFIPCATSSPCSVSTPLHVPLSHSSPAHILSSHASPAHTQCSSNDVLSQVLSTMSNTSMDSNSEVITTGITIIVRKERHGRNTFEIIQL